MPDLDYSKFYAKKGPAYSSTVDGSYYNLPVDKSPGRSGGNSRIWGDASEETQKASIDAIIAAAKTTQAFRSVLEDEDADNLTRSFGRGLGLL